MRFWNLVIAALSVPLCVDGNLKDDAAKDTNVASFGGMNHLSMDDALMTLRSFRNDKAGLAPIDLDAWTQAMELQNPEYEIGDVSRVGSHDDEDFAIDIGVPTMERKLSTECASYPVLNETGQLSTWDFYILTHNCYSGSPSLEDCPEMYSVPLNCWNTSLMTDLSDAFKDLSDFNDDISSWDVGNVTSLSSTFAYAFSFNSDISSWDTRKVTDMRDTFEAALSFNSDISSWETGKVTSLRATFADASSFNSDISSWDTGEVTDLSYTFWGASSFDVDISSWDTGKVTSLRQTFGWASRFNSELSSWETGKVTDMLATFKNASSFNSDISSWETGNVTDMTWTFNNASSFNADISSWDTGKVTRLDFTFSGASSFNADISSWEIGKVTELLSTFEGASSFNSDISSWDTGKVKNMDSMFLNATKFNQCLGKWAAKTPDTVSTSSMLKNTACPKQSDPNPRKGPWCQGFEDRCFGACRDAKQFRFGKNDRKSCDSINDITAPTKKKIRRFCNRKVFGDDEATSGKTIRVKDVCQKACGSRGFGPGEKCDNGSLN